MRGGQLAGVVWAALALAPVGHAAAQTSGARATAEALFERLAREDWAATADLVLPASRERLRDIALITTHLQLATEGESGSGGLSQAEVPGPAELAPYASRRIEGLQGVRTLGELAALSSAAFVARWFESLDAELGISGIPRVIVDVVEEGDSLAHVLYRPHYAAAKGRGRMEFGNPPPLDWSVQVLTLRQTSTGWRAYLNGELTFYSPLRLISVVDE